VWEIAWDPNVAGGHATQKPVEAMERPIRNHEAPSVYDPFLGSGTTLIACERAGRQLFAMEIDPCYIDVAVSRWERFTEGTASRVTNGTRGE
jgi:DNA modification methylase